MKDDFAKGIQIKEVKVKGNWNRSQRQSFSKMGSNQESRRRGEGQAFAKMGSDEGMMEKKWKKKVFCKMGSNEGRWKRSQGQSFQKMGSNEKVEEEEKDKLLQKWVQMKEGGTKVN